MKKNSLIIASLAIAAALSFTHECNAQCWRPFARLRAFAAPCYNYTPCCRNAYSAPLSASNGSCTNGTCSAAEYLPSETKKDTDQATECATGTCPLRQNVEAHVATLIERVNAVRARYGLKALVEDSTMTSGCNNHTQNLAAHGTLYHVACNEIIAYNYTSFDGAIAQWLASPAHSALLLSNFTTCGVATYRDANGRVWSCMRFR